MVGNPPRRSSSPPAADVARCAPSAGQSSVSLLVLSPSISAVPIPPAPTARPFPPRPPATPLRNGARPAACSPAPAAPSEIPSPPNTNHAAPDSTLQDCPPAAAVPPSVVQTRAAPPCYRSQCRARPTADPPAATAVAARTASNIPHSCSSGNPATPLQAGATSPEPDSNARSRTPSSDTPALHCPQSEPCSDR